MLVAALKTKINKWGWATNRLSHPKAKEELNHHPCPTQGHDKTSGTPTLKRAPLPSGSALVEMSYPSCFLVGAHCSSDSVDEIIAPCSSDTHLNLAFPKRPKSFSCKPHPALHRTSPQVEYTFGPKLLIIDASSQHAHLDATHDIHPIHSHLRATDDMVHST